MSVEMLTRRTRMEGGKKTRKKEKAKIDPFWLSRATPHPLNAYDPTPVAEIHPPC